MLSLILGALLPTIFTVDTARKLELNIANNNAVFPVYLTSQNVFFFASIDINVHCCILAISKISKVTKSKYHLCNV